MVVHHAALKMYEACKPTFTYIVLWIKTRLADGSFAIGGPLVCNMLTAALYLVDNYTHFVRLLKAQLFD